MLWKEVKTWCKENGYKADRTKNKEEENSYNYTWVKIDDESINGTATSVSKLAAIIYNRITNNQHLEYQQSYIKQQALSDIKHEQGF